MYYRSMKSGWNERERRKRNRLAPPRLEGLRFSTQTRCCLSMTSAPPKISSLRRNRLSRVSPNANLLTKREETNVARKSHASREGIEAASKTYIRCTKRLCEELDVEPVGLGLGPRADFEETVTIIRAILERRGEDDSNPGDLTHADFSFNEVLRLMRLTALELAEPKRYTLTREAFIRHVNNVLQETGGLTVNAHLFPSAATGRYAWIQSHLQTFLRRHRDVVRRSTTNPDLLIIAAARPQIHV